MADDSSVAFQMPAQGTKDPLFEDGSKNKQRKHKSVKKKNIHKKHKSSKKVSSQVGGTKGPISYDCPNRGFSSWCSLRLNKVPRLSFESIYNSKRVQTPFLVSGVSFGKMPMLQPIVSKTVTTLVSDFGVYFLNKLLDFAAEAPPTRLLGSVGSFVFASNKMLKEPQRKRKSFKKDASQGTSCNMADECSTSQNDIIGAPFRCNYGELTDSSSSMDVPLSVWGTKGPMNEDSSDLDIAKKVQFSCFAILGLLGFRGSLGFNAFNKVFEKQQESPTKDLYKCTSFDMTEECSTSGSDFIGDPFACNIGEPIDFLSSMAYPFPALGTKGPMNDYGPDLDISKREKFKLVQQFDSSFASIGLLGSGGSLGFNVFNEMFKKQRESSRKYPPSQSGDWEHEAMGDKRRKDSLVIPKSNRKDLSDVAKDLIVDVAKPLVADFGKNLKSQPLPNQILAIFLIGLLAIAANVPSAMWQANFKKFILCWSAAVQKTVPMIGFLCNFVLEPKVALVFIISASVLVGLFIGYWIGRDRPKAIPDTSLPGDSIGGFGTEVTDGPVGGPGSNRAELTPVSGSDKRPIQIYADSVYIIG